MKFEPLQKKPDLLKPSATFSDCCCNPQDRNSNDDLICETENFSWFAGVIDTPAGSVPRVSTKMKFSDRIGHFLARTTSFRMKFSVEPGLYAAGTPDSESDIFVTANYKLSFDHLRKSLHGINAWILVLDTAGINVWCAAGKGTFGTEEVIRRIKLTCVEKCVSHRRIILPQLGAPGVDSGEVRKNTGFRISFGPVRADDIRKYVESGYKADGKMRLVRFSIIDRTVLVPIEVYMIKDKFLLFIPGAFIYSALRPEGIIFSEIMTTGFPLLIAGIISVAAGAVLTPVFLPFIPFRAFSLKGGIAGAAALTAADYFTDIFSSVSPYFHAAILILFTLIASYLALQFTGATTYTSLSGVKREIRYSLPVYITGFFVSSILLVISKINEWGYL